MGSSSLLSYLISSAKVRSPLRRAPNSPLLGASAWGHITSSHCLDKHPRTDPWYVLATLSKVAASGSFTHRLIAPKCAILHVFGGRGGFRPSWWSIYTPEWEGLIALGAENPITMQGISIPSRRGSKVWPATLCAVFFVKHGWDVQ